MKIERNSLLSEYPYIWDGQFANENIQEELVQYYCNSLDLSSNDFVHISDEAIVHARLLKWDTEHFGIPMARIEHFYFARKPKDSKVYSELLSWLNTSGIKHISARINVQEQTEINFLTRDGFQFISAKLMLRIELSKSKTGNEVSGGCFFSNQLEERQIDILLNIASNNFKVNRFVLDECLDSNQALRVYDRWVINEIGKGQDNLLIIKMMNYGIVGFALVDTWRPVSSAVFGFVSLIAIERRFQGQGLGKVLLEECLRRFKAKEINTVFANVVASNFGSLGLFQNCGFKVYSNLLELRKYMD